MGTAQFVALLLGIQPGNLGDEGAMDWRGSIAHWLQGLTWVLSLKYWGFIWFHIHFPFIFIKFWELLVHWQLEQWLQIPAKRFGEMRCIEMHRGWTGFRKRIAVPYALRHGSLDGD